MTEINEDVLAILKALTEKVETLEKAVYNKDNLLMKSGLVVANSPTPAMTGLIGGNSTTDNVANMEWSEIHKMMEKVGGN